MTPEQVTALMDQLTLMHEQQLQITQSICWLLGALSVILFSIILKPFE